MSTQLQDGYLSLCKDIVERFLRKFLPTSLQNGYNFFTMGSLFCLLLWCAVRFRLPNVFDYEFSFQDIIAIMNNSITPTANDAAVNGNLKLLLDPFLCYGAMEAMFLIVYAYFVVYRFLLNSVIEYVKRVSSHEVSISGDTAINGRRRRGANNPREKNFRWKEYMTREVFQTPIKNKYLFVCIVLAYCLLGTINSVFRETIIQFFIAFWMLLLNVSHALAVVFALPMVAGLVFIKNCYNLVTAVGALGIAIIRSCTW